VKELLKLVNIWPSYLQTKRVPFYGPFYAFLHGGHLCFGSHIGFEKNATLLF